MEISLEKGEPFELGWKRIVSEQCAYAIDVLEKGDNLHDAIHEARKSLKKIRAALRLVRSEIPFYKKENIFFRDRGRMISDIRDYTSIQEALEKLAEQPYAKGIQDTFDHLGQKLMERRDLLAKSVVEDQHVPEILVADLKDKLKKIKDWPLRVEGFSTMAKGIRKVYQQGYKSCQKANKSRSNAEFHEWRKKAKYLQYQMSMLKPVWPDFMEAWVNEFHVLTDLLGLEHDLALLGKTIREESFEFRSLVEEENFFHQIKKYQKQLRVHAILQGKRCYTEDTKELVKRLAKYWKVYQEELKVS